ncbi:MAG: hypothetical protein J6Z08_02385 [Elusimicrobiales bacterium]|nr:hypothetical protein [Elusimicrobiales bacterium]
MDIQIDSPMINTHLTDTMLSGALWEAMNNYHMGITEENIAEKKTTGHAMLCLGGGVDCSTVLRRYER